MAGMADRPWLPDHPVDEALARRAVADRFPELAGIEPRHLGRGFDNDVWRFGETVFRFPRRAVAVPLLEIEARALPYLAARLPLPIPAPSHLGAPGAAFPLPFYGHPYLPGLTADRARLGPAARAALVPALAGFLKALHAIDPAEAARRGVPADTFRGRLAGQEARRLERLALFEGSPWAGLVPAMAERLAAPPPDGAEPPVVLHGDLYARHLLLDGSARLAGLIDWGDVCLGDRAVDLAVAYTFLPPASRAAFWAAYGPVDEATRARARYIAFARHGLHLGPYARDVGDEDLAVEAGVALGHALS